MKFKTFSIEILSLLQFNEVLIIVKEKRESFVFNPLKTEKLYVLKVRRIAASSAGESSGLGHIGTSGHRAQFCCGLWLDGWLNTKLTEIVCDDETGSKFSIWERED